LQGLRFAGQKLSLLSERSQDQSVVFLTHAKCLQLGLVLPQLFLQFLGFASTQGLCAFAYFFISELDLAQLAQDIFYQCFNLLQIFRQSELLLLFRGSRRCFGLAGQLLLDIAADALLVVQGDVRDLLDAGTDLREELAVFVDFLGIEEGNIY
jgi:hypothetical protein